MHEKMEALVSEINMLRRQTSHSGREKQYFKEFVALKRDMGILREENDELKTRLKLATGTGKVGNLPSLKHNGTSEKKEKRGKDWKS